MKYIRGTGLKLKTEAKFMDYAASKFKGVKAKYFIKGDDTFLATF